MPHLHPLPPIKLQYTIRVDPNHHSSPEPTIYDIRVATEDPIKIKTIAMTQNPEYAIGLRQIAQLDDALAVIVQAIQHSKAKHTFYRSMAKDPVNFIRRWMSSQKRDLEVIMGEATRGGGEDGSGIEFQRGGSKGMWDSPVSSRVAFPWRGDSLTPCPGRQRSCKIYARKGTAWRTMIQFLGSPAMMTSAYS